MRELLNLLESISAQWPDRLNGGSEIASYVENLSDYDVDTGLIEDNYRGAVAILRKVAINTLHGGDEDHNISDPKKEKRYRKMPLDTMPPILVEDGMVMDGNHRFRAAKALGATEILAYVIEWED